MAVMLLSQQMRWRAALSRLASSFRQSAPALTRAGAGMNRLLLGVAAACLCAAVVAMAAMAKDAPVRRRFATIIEPSGVAQSPDGRMLVVDDQPATALTTLTIGPDLSVSETPIAPGLVARMLGRDPLGGQVDLEAIEVAPDGLTYVATSHSRDDSGRRQDDREKPTALRLRGDRIAEAAVFPDLRVAIGALDGALKKAAHERDVKDEGGLNIEALSMGPDGALLIGLRTPVIGRDAVILALENPAETVMGAAAPRLRPAPVRLDLGGGRGIARRSVPVARSRSPSSALRSLQEPRRICLGSGGGAEPSRAEPS